MAHNIINWNCRGFKMNLREIQMFMSEYDPLAICLQETFLRANKTINMRKYDSYHSFSLSSDDRAIGGCSILIKKRATYRHLKLNTELQAVAVSVSLHKTFTLCTLYLPPSRRVMEQELEDLISQLPAPFILLGDFNAHNHLWGGKYINTKGKTLENIISSHNLCIFNDGSPTHIDPASQSLTSIDLSLCSPSLYADFNWSVHNDLCGSNHFPTFLSFSDFKMSERIPQWNLKRADWLAFERICCAELQPSYFNDIKDDKVDIFTSSLHFIAEMTIPKTSAVPKKKNKPWWNDECQVSLNARTRALDFFKRFPTKENQDNYRRAYARARRVMQESMRSSWRQYVSKLNNNTPMNKVWDMFRKITGKKVNCNSVKHLKVNDDDITDRNDIANILAETVSRNSSSVNYDDKFQQNKAKAEKKKLNFTSQNMESYNSLFTLEELQESLARAHDTAVGPDDIHYQLLKHLPSNSLLLLLHIFNDIWTTGIFPSCWRQATIIPIPKPGKDSTNPTNYRPIALTSCLCKTMERMVNNRLVYYLEYNGILTAYQSGFRKNRSTIDQIIRLETAVREAFIKREHAVAIFFDLEKAYDTTWKYGIMRDLHDAGLRGRLPIFISNFLSNREFRVRLGTIGSNLYSQEEGVPQGSILSVTLFSLKINSIVHCLSDGVDCSLYVDDFLICYRGKQMHTIERKLQLCLKKIQEWAEENGFRFSKSKTVCMHFCTLRKEHADPTLILNGTEIPLVEEFKFLGVIFDKKLSFKSHINYIKVKCSRALNLLKVVSNMNWGADRDVLLRLYRSLIRSKLDYGCIVYGSARPSYIKALDTIHNQGIRICLGAFRTSPMESLYVEADEPSLYRRREKLALQYAIKLKSLPQNPTYEVTFNPQYVDLFENKPKAIPPFGIRIQRLSAQLDADINCIAETKLSDVPPWEFQKPKMNYDMHSGKKRDTDPFDYQVSFHDIQAKYHDHDFYLY